jgi:hypothetical protein
LIHSLKATASPRQQQQISEEAAVYDSQSYLIDNLTQIGGEDSGESERRNRIPGRLIKTMETPRELRALISYLRQQEAEVLEAMQRLLDA